MNRLPNSQRRLWLSLLSGSILVGVAFLFDNRVGEALDILGNPTFKKVAQICSKIGEGWVIAVVGLPLAALCFFLSKTQLAARIFFVTVGSELVGLFAVILRLVFGRARPSNQDVPPGFYGLWHDGHWIAGQFKFSSFPSGHAATATGLVALAWVIHRGWALALLPYAVAVIWSRIALQCHHLSDVLASAVLAMALAIWFKRALLPSVEFQFGNLRRAWKGK